MTCREVGFIYEDVFKELYTGTSTASADPAEEKEEEEAGVKLRRRNTDLHRTESSLVLVPSIGGFWTVQFSCESNGSQQQERLEFDPENTNLQMAGDVHKHATFRVKAYMPRCFKHTR